LIGAVQHHLKISHHLQIEYFDPSDGNYQPSTDPSVLSNTTKLRANVAIENFFISISPIFFRQFFFWQIDKKKKNFNFHLGLKTSPSCPSLPTTSIPTKPAPALSPVPSTPLMMWSNGLKKLI